MSLPNGPHYMPSTEEVRRAYSKAFRFSSSQPRARDETSEEQFDRWLAEHDRQTRTAALLDAASAVNTKASWLEILSRSDAPIMREKFARWLRERERLGHPSSCNFTPCTGRR